MDCFFDCFELLLKKLTSSVASESVEAELTTISLISLFQVYQRFGSHPTEPSSSVFSVLFTFVTDQFKKFVHPDANIRTNLLGAALSYLVDYLERLPAEERNLKVDALISYIIEPFLSSNEGILALERVALSKLAPNSIHSERNRDTWRKVHSNNLSYLPTIVNFNQLEDASIRFMISYVRFCQLAVLRLKANATNEQKFSDIRRLLSNEYLKSYFKVFIKNCSESTNNELLLNRQENAFIYHTIRLVFQIYTFEVLEFKMKGINDFENIITIKLILRTMKKTSTKCQ